MDSYTNMINYLNIFKQLLENIQVAVNKLFNYCFALSKLPYVNFSQSANTIFLLSY